MRKTLMRFYTLYPAASARSPNEFRLSECCQVVKKNIGVPTTTRLFCALIDESVSRLPEKKWRLALVPFSSVRITCSRIYLKANISQGHRWWAAVEPVPRGQNPLGPFVSAHTCNPLLVNQTKKGSRLLHVDCMSAQRWKTDRPLTAKEGYICWKLWGKLLLESYAYVCLPNRPVFAHASIDYPCWLCSWCAV